MLRERSRLVNGALATVIALVAAPGLIECKQMGGKGGPGVPGLGGGGNCPQSPDDIAKASWGLNAEIEGKVKAALDAAATLKEISAKLEADVTAACGDLAKDLGATDADLATKEQGPGKQAEAACGAAAKLIGEVKAKAKGKFEVKAKE